MKKFAHFKLSATIIMMICGMISFFGQHASALSAGWMIMSDNDYGCGWEFHPGWSSVSIVNSLEIAMNLAMFAAGGGNSLTIKQARYDAHSSTGNGSWMPDPGSIENLQQYANQFAARTGVQVQAGYADLNLTDLENVNLLYITAHYAFTLTDAAKASLKSFLDRGGVLFGDDCSGAQDFGFEASFRQLANDLYGRSINVLSSDHPIYSSYFALNGNDFSYTYAGNGTELGQRPLEGISSEIPLCDGVESEITLTPFADVLNLVEQTPQRDSHTLLMTCGEIESVTRVVQPPRRVMAAEAATLRFILTSDSLTPQGLFSIPDGYYVYMSLLSHTPLSEVNAATLHSLKWQTVTSSSTLSFLPNQVAIFKTAFGAPFAMQMISANGLQSIQIRLKRFINCPPNQMEDIVITPEPATFALFGLGIVGLFALLRHKRGIRILITLLAFNIALSGLSSSADAQEACTITIEKVGDGTVWAGDKECGADCQTVEMSCDPKTGYVLQAIPAEGSAFVGWRDGHGGVIDIATYRVTPNDAKIMAIFETQTWYNACDAQFQESITCIRPLLENEESDCHQAQQNAETCFATRDFDACIDAMRILNRKVDGSGCGYELETQGCNLPSTTLLICANPFLDQCKQCTSEVFRNVDSACHRGVADAEVCLLDSDLMSHLERNSSCENMFAVIGDDMMCRLDIKNAKCHEACGLTITEE